MTTATATMATVNEWSTTVNALKAIKGENSRGYNPPVAVEVTDGIVALTRACQFTKDHVHATAYLPAPAGLADHDPVLVAVGDLKAAIDGVATTRAEKAQPLAVELTADGVKVADEGVETLVKTQTFDEDKDRSGLCQYVTLSEGAETVELTVDMVRDIVANAKPYVCKDLALSMIASVAFGLVADRVTAFATDRFKMLRMELPETANTNMDYTPAPTLNVPWEVLTVAEHLMKHADGDTPVTISHHTGNSQAVIEWEGGRVAAPREGSGDFPAVNALIPATRECHITIDAGTMAKKVAKVVKALPVKKGKDMVQITPDGNDLLLVRDTGAAQVTVRVENVDHNLTGIYAFNPQYLKELFATPAFAGDVTFHMDSNVNKPTVLTPAGVQNPRDSHVLALLMPVRQPE